MLHSMTGFARESAETELGTLTWEIRAVNHRYLDVQFKMPEDLRSKEQVFRQADRRGHRSRQNRLCTVFFARQGLGERAQCRSMQTWSSWSRQTLEQGVTRRTSDFMGR